MKKRLVALCMAVMMIAVVFTVAGVKNDSNISDVSYAQRNTYGEGETVQTTAQSTSFTNRVDDFIGDKVDSASNAYDIMSDLAGMAGDIGGYVTMGSGGLGDMGGLGGIGDALGGVGDAVGNIFGGDNSTPTQNNAGVTYSVVESTVGQIQVVPAATQNYGTVPVVSTPSAQTPLTTISLNTAETVDFAAVQCPYQKPTGELKGGDTGEGVKWMQWIFIYTRYGLKDDGITGVFDEDTMAVVKKLQKENNMTVNGIVNDAVIDKIENLFYTATYTQPTVVATTSGNVSNITSPVVVPEQDNTILVLLFVIVLLAWILVIVFVVTMVLKSKKKKAQAKKKTEASSVSEGKNEISEKTEVTEENK